MSGGSQWLRRSVGSVGLGVTSATPAAAPDSSASNRRVLAVRRVWSLLGLLASQLRIPLSPPLHSAAFALVERALQSRYGDGQSRWTQQVCLCCLYLAHRQHAPQRVLRLHAVAAAVHMQPLALARMLRSLRQQLSIRLQPHACCDEVEQLLAAVDWKEDEAAAVQGRLQVREKAEQLLQLMRRQQELHSAAVSAPSVLTAGAVYLVLLCHPYCGFHRHEQQRTGRGSSSLLPLLSGRAAVSARSIRSSQQAVQRRLLELSRSCLPQSSPATGTLPVELVLQQLHLLLLLLPEQPPQPQTQDESVRVEFECEPELGEKAAQQARQQRAEDEELSSYCRTETEMRDWQRLHDQQLEQELHQNAADCAALQ